MTRLFFRFYVGIVAVLIVAWLVQAHVTNLSSTQNAAVIENALAGGVRLARARVEEFWHEDPAISTSNYFQVAGNFEYPMYLTSFKDATWLEDPYRQRLIDGDVVLLREYLGIAVFPPPQPEESIADELDSSGSSDSQPPTEPTNQTDTASRTLDKAEPKYFLLFGPLPQFVGPSGAQVTLGYGIVFLLTALSIAILLRPVANQFRVVERTATLIANGDLHARIPTTSRSDRKSVV